jgi:hypothetical protein
MNLFDKECSMKGPARWLSVALLMASFMPATSSAQMMMEPLGTPSASAPLYTLKPLMVVRFNQRKVYYEQPLFNTFSRALSVKPNATFDIIGVSPAGQEQKGQQALQDVMATVRKIGVPSTQLTSRMEQDASLRAPEVRIFVR